jgi:outer membrane protein
MSRLSLANNRQNLLKAFSLLFAPVTVILLSMQFPVAFCRESALILDTELKPEIRPVYSLSTAVETAVKNYPTLRRATATLTRNSSEVTLAKTAYLPTLDALAQEVRTTTNNVAGTIFPQSLNVIPMQTGPAVDSSSMKSIFANNYGLNFSWLVYDFGQRHAGVQVARAQVAQAGAGLKLTELDIACAAAEAYLTTVEAKEKIRAQRATVARMQAWNLIVKTLVDKGLRPGVDAARAAADLSFAKIALIEVEREADLASVDLSEAMGIAGHEVTIDDRPWIRRPERTQIFTAPLIDTHPLAILKQAQIFTAHEKVISMQKTYRPRLWFHSGIWSRGSGSRIEAHPVVDGLLPQNANYVAGLAVDFPFMNYFPIKAKVNMARENENEERANYDLAIQELTKKDARARVMLKSAKQMADETPILVAAANENQIKASERYKVGLANVLEVAESQRILENASVQDAVAQVRIWRAILSTAYAHGELKPFMDLVASAEASIK